MTRDDAIRTTASHIRRVGELLVKMSNDLNIRAVNHDKSKWSPEEWPLFESSSHKLASMTYGSEEYKAALEAIRPALDNHYSINSHHPEYSTNGVNDMTLLDLIEMICDWKAATERHNDGSIARSLEHNKTRFGLEPQLLKILENTFREKGWII